MNLSQAKSTGTTLNFGWEGLRRYRGMLHKNVLDPLMAKVDLSVHEQELIENNFKQDSLPA